jgi:hypothetical protein
MLETAPPIKNKKLTIRHLIYAFEQSGMEVSPSWVRRQEEKGNLIIPRSTTNYKMAQGSRRPGAVRYMTATQIIDIVKAFLPEGTKLPNGERASGKGYYNYKND